MGEIICFRIVKEPYGWAVRIGEGCMTPFESRSLALRHANGMARKMRDRGERAEVVIEEPQTLQAPVRKSRKRKAEVPAPSHDWSSGR